MKKKFLIFDVDGVLLNTLDYHFQRCLKIAKEPFTKEEFLAHHEGNFYLKSEKNIFEGVNWRDYYPLIVNCYPNLIVCKTIVNVLKNFYKNENFVMGIVSSGHEDYIKENFRKNNILKYFHFIYGKQTGFTKVKKFELIFSEYAVSPDDCIFITDTLGDIKESSEVGIPTYGITGGYHSRDTLLKGSPIAVVQSLDELQKLLI